MHPENSTNQRVVCWFQCGIASAVATKLALQNSNFPIDIYYCKVVEEHADNERFLKDCEQWFGQKINIIGNQKYNYSAKEVFLKTKYLVGPSGARCTLELKKQIRWEHSKFDDIIVLGYTSEEQKRIDRIKKTEPLVNFWPILIEKNLTKQDCKNLVVKAGINIPEMYKLGYKNNNCIGCVKGQAGYWNKIRKDFPDVFDQMSKDLGNYKSEPDVECGIYCQMAEKEMT